MGAIVGEAIDITELALMMTIGGGHDVNVGAIEKIARNEKVVDGQIAEVLT